MKTGHVFPSTRRYDLLIFIQIIVIVYQTFIAILAIFPLISLSDIVSNLAIYPLISQ
jgi:hypothetical protein